VHLASGQPAEAGEIVIAADRFRLRYRIPVPAAGHDPAEPALRAMAYAPPGAGVPAARAEPPR
jgi:hypothetical protein